MTVTATLPKVLVAPPWASRGAAAKPVVIKGLTAPAGASVAWAEGERDELLATRFRDQLYPTEPDDAAIAARLAEKHDFRIWQHVLADDERSCLVLKRFAGIDMPAGRVFGLTRRGWRRGEPWGDGYEMHIERPLPDGRVVIANIRPGIAVGFVSEAEDQCFADIWVSRDGEADYRPVPEWSDPFGTLDPVTASEILRDLTEVTAQ